MSETYRNRAARAAAVTRALRAADIVVLPSGTPRSREGIRVSAKSGASALVSIDLDTPSLRARVREVVVEVLAAAGYAIRPNPEADWLLTVNRED